MLIVNAENPDLCRGHGHISFRWRGLVLQQQWIDVTSRQHPIGVGPHAEVRHLIRDLGPYVKDTAGMMTMSPACSLRLYEP